MLTGTEIIKMVKEKRIHISPFQEALVNPNSVNLTLSDELLEYDRYTTFDMKKGTSKPPRKIYIHPEIGYTLSPEKLYLGSTVEECGSDEFVTCLEGRSSLARMGLEVHLTAGFGDLGFKSRWTMEMRVHYETTVYPFVAVCQAVFYVVTGDRTMQYKGKYKDQSKGPTESKYHTEFTKSTESTDA
jgi:dCTP deaminase